MRGELVELSNGAALINDSYNSSPAALNSLTELLAETTGYRRRILASGRNARIRAYFRGVHRRRELRRAIGFERGKIDWMVGVAATRRK